MSEPLVEVPKPLKIKVSTPEPSEIISFPARPLIVSLPFPEIIWSSELVPIKVSLEASPFMAKEKLSVESPLMPSVISVAIVSRSATSSAIIAAVLLLFRPYK